MSVFSKLDPRQFVIQVAALVLLATSLAAVAALMAAGTLRRKPAAAHCVLTWALIWVLSTPVVAVGFAWSGHWILSIPVFRLTTKGIVDPATRQSSEPAVVTASAAPETADVLRQHQDDSSARNRPVDLSAPTHKPLDMASASTRLNFDGGAGASVHPETAVNPLHLVTGRLLRTVAGIAVEIWLIGTGLLLAGIAAAYVRLRRIRGSLMPLRNDSLSPLLADLARKLKVARLPEICESDRLGVPCVVGIARPVIALPRGWVDTLNTEQLRDVLIHEWAHVLRHDCSIVLLQKIAAAICWPNLFVHWLNRRLANVREQVCDNYVLTQSEAVTYGETLWQLARLSRTHRPVLASVSILHRGGQLEERIAGLVDEKRNQQTRIKHMPAIAIGAALGVLCVLACGSTVRSDQAPSKPSPGPIAIEDRPSDANSSVDSENPRVTKVFTIQRSKASAIAQAIKDVYRDLLIASDQKTNGAPKQPLSIRFDDASNTVHVSCPKSQMDEIKRFVEALDQDPAARINPGAKNSTDSGQPTSAPHKSATSPLSNRSSPGKTAIEDRPADANAIPPESENPRVTKIFPVRHSKASAIAQAIRDVYRDLITANEMANGRHTKPLLSIGVDEASNMLLVSCPRSLMKSIEAIVETLDKGTAARTILAAQNPKDREQQAATPHKSAKSSLQELLKSFEMFRGQGNTHFVPPNYREQLGIELVEARKPAPRRLMLLGSTAPDPSRVIRIRARFVGPQSSAEVIQIGELTVGGSTSSTSNGKDGVAATGSTSTTSRELRPGDRVAKGTLLAAFNSGDVARKENDLIGAINRLKIDEQILKVAQNQAGATNELTTLNARRDVQSDRNTIDRAASTLNSWGLSEDEIQAVRKTAENGDQANIKHQISESLRLGRVEIRSPMGGVILERNLALHEVVADNSVNFFQIANMDELEVVANIPADDVSDLVAVPPQRRRWRIYPGNGTAVEGMIEQVGQTIDPTTGTATVRGRIDNQNHELRAGMFLRVQIEVPISSDVVEVPRGAIAYQGDETFVFVLADRAQNFYTKRRVEILRSFNNVVFLRSRPSQPNREPQNLAGDMPVEPLNAGETVLAQKMKDLGPR